MELILLKKINPNPVIIIPISITFLGPNLFMKNPTNGDIIPDSVLCIDITPDVIALLHPKCITIGSKNAPKPCLKVPDVYANIIAPLITIHQPGNTLEYFLNK